MDNELQDMLPLVKPIQRKLEGYELYREVFKSPKHVLAPMVSLFVIQFHSVLSLPQG